MQDELTNAIDCIRALKQGNRYRGNRIGRLRMSHGIPASFTYQIGDVVLFTDDEGDRVTISRPWREVQIQTRPGCTEVVGAETIANLPREYVEEYDSARIPKGLYQQSCGIGQVILQSIDELACNGHREAAFLLLLNVIAGLSRRRYPVPETPEGLKDKRKYNRQLKEGTALRDGEAFAKFVDEELRRVQNAHPEYGHDFSNLSFYTLGSNCQSIGEWLYSYFRCVLVHNTKTSSAYRLDMRCDTLTSRYLDIANGTSTKCIAFGFFRLLRHIVANAEENDESF